ncbi:MAG: hypothetical protein ACJ749_06340 [Flavisolibacter sp.]
MTKTLYEECIEITRSLVGQEYLYFNDPVEVKVSPHSPSFNTWAVCISPSDKLYVMDNNEEWHEVELNDINGALVIGSLYQRLKMLRINYAKAS